jgi:hypothetical protein
MFPLVLRASLVKCVDRSYSLAGAHDSLALRDYLDGGFGHDSFAGSALGEYPERLQLKEVGLPAGKAARQELERTIRRFKVVTLVFKLLHFLDNCTCGFVVNAKVEIEATAYKPRNG